MKILLRFLTALLFFIGTIVQMNAVEPARSRLDSLITSLSGDDDEELTEILRNMPNIEVGRGISFKPKNESYKLTMRFRMQNMVGVELNKDFTATETEARVNVCVYALTVTYILLSLLILFSWVLPLMMRKYCRTGI